MQTIKRFLALGLLALVVVTGVAACGQTTSLGGSGGAPQHYQPSGGGGQHLK